MNGRLVLAGGSYWSEGRNLWTGGPALPAPLSDASIGGLTDERPSLDTLILRGAEWSAVPRLRLPEPKIRAASAADSSSSMTNRPATRCGFAT